MRDYCIEARAYRLALATHNFWVLRETATGQSIAELHGMATDRVTGRTVPIGVTPEHRLRAHVFPHDPAYAASLALPIRVTRMYGLSRARIVHEGGDALERWSAAVKAIPFINELDLDYPPWGFNLRGPTVNSNSAYRTFGELMGIPVHDFPFGFAPGLRWRLITLEQTERLRFQAAATETSLDFSELP
jgi:hypothetical protein